MAQEMISALQRRFVDKLNVLSQKYGNNTPFEEVTWLRDNGVHGGGNRYEARDKELFNTASVNVSHIHYDDLADKQLASATAISTIIHPNNPHAPSIHIHISKTCLKNGKFYWRIMADLNPAIPYDEDTERFREALKELSGEYFQEGSQQGDKYFNIPALSRTRGVAHFYLENFTTQEPEDAATLARSFGEGIIDTYIEILNNAFASRVAISEVDTKRQREYHTLYLFQVLTLDRGTTSGLLVHNQNDVGIMGSLPRVIDTPLLRSWAEKVEPVQRLLIENLADAIGERGIVDVAVKQQLANVVREHYKNHPEALSLQASGNTIPSTVANHKA